jgi:SAM-dependent methyltransferase
MEKMLGLLRNFKRLLGALLHREPSDEFQYWKLRVSLHGRRSVLNLGHSDEEYDKVTSWQQGELFPFLLRELKGGEKSAVDFGCGPGRHTGELARAIKGKVYGADPMKGLLALAPAREGVEYLLMRDGKVPLEDGCADLVWVCLVLGGLREKKLAQAAAEIDRLLKPEGLLFLVENTADKPHAAWWHFHPVEFYQKLFPSVGLRHLHDYSDLGERISVLSGRKLGQ